MKTGWKPYNGGSLSDGISAGLTADGREVYVGRGTFQGQLAPGSLYTSGSGNRKAGFYMEHSRGERFISTGVEYYAKQPQCSFKWVPSKNGETVENAVKHKSNPYTFYVGRTFYQGSWYVGKVTLEAKTMYFGPGLDINSYDVLICEKNERNLSDVNLTALEKEMSDLKLTIAELQSSLKLITAENSKLKSELANKTSEIVTLTDKLAECW